MDRFPDSTARTKAFEVFQRIDRASAIGVGATSVDGEVPFFRFDEEAQACFVDWRETLEFRLRSGEDHPAPQAHLSKYRKAVPSLALDFHLADETAGGRIGVDTLCRATAWMPYLESHAKRAYGAVVQAQVQSARALITRLRRGDLKSPFALRDVYRNGWAGLATRTIVQAAAELLVEFDHLRSARVNDTGGAPKTIFEINPKALQ